MRLLRAALGAALVLSATLAGGASAAPAASVEMAVHEVGGGSSTMRVPLATLSALSEKVPPAAPRKAASAAGIYSLTNGKTAAWTGDGKIQGCSASVVNTPSRRVLVTAAHCLYHHGMARPWIQTMRFVPGLEPDANEDPFEPIGGFEAARFVVPKSWTLVQDRKWDFGFVIMKDRPNGDRVGDLVSSHGLWFNAPHSQQTQVVGYPITVERGFRQVFCGGIPGRIAVDDAHIMRCGLGGEASGGPWLYDYDANGLGLVMGVTSEHHSGGDNTAAYFGDLARSIYDQVKDL
ncbi:trypsin-like serine peptidase [Crossiella cryophila]|uniref:V8-like Glu-specific endopeptidase n=1 Tax=Crossiella cryophila TaxID=43355 RepID=A0A7W7CJ53_9PSEU|nr:hypothetical protein [Crossiella cryophila]MBB4682151.1 hypothetical protein [Crossiella cryophila]